MKNYACVCLHVSEIISDSHTELNCMYNNQQEETDHVYSGAEIMDNDTDVEDTPKQTRRKGMCAYLRTYVALSLCIYIYISLQDKT